MRELPFQNRAWMSLRSASSAAAATSIAIMIVLMVAARPVPVRASAPTRLLWIADNGIYRRVACEQVATGTHITLFSCGEPRLASGDAETIVHAFDHHIFPTDAEEFGVPRGLNTVNAVLVPFTGMTFGYFDENDLAPGPSSAAVHSNHGNFLYVRSLASMPDANKMMDVQEALAHELQHLLDYRVRVLDRGLAPQEVWLNEGLSFYAQISNGYWTPRDSLRVDASAADPAWSLTAMTESSQFLRQHGRVAYGRAGMFVTYLAAQYGLRFTRDVVRNRQTGLEGIDAVLRQEHHGSVADAFTRWGVAQLLNVPGKYGYEGLLGAHSRTPRLMYPTVTSYPFDTGSAGHPAMTLQPWTQRYVRFATAGEFAATIRVTTPPTCRLAAVYRTSAAPGDVTVRMLKVGATHTASLRVGGNGQHYETVTLVVSAVGSLRAVPVDARPATVRIQASSINARHYQRVPRTASAAGQDADVTL